MKKSLRFFIAVISVISIFFTIFIPAVSAAPALDTELLSQCKEWMVVDSKSGTVIAKSDTYQDKISPASTTKILTAIIALDKCQLTDAVTIDPKATILGSDSSKCGLVAGETLTVKDLIYGMMLVSGNDAALALAYHISGSIDAFAELMNQKAQEIGMTNSHFANPHGLDNDEHYVTCEDMAKLAVYATGYSELMKISSTQTYTIPATSKSIERLITSTNKLLYTPDSDSVSYKYEYTTGLKTGSTYRAGGCIVATATKGDQERVALVFGDPTNGGVNRWKIAKYLLEYSFNNFTTVSIGENINNMEIMADICDATDSSQTSQIKLDMDIPEDLVVTVDNETLGDSPEFTYKVETDTPLRTPVNKGDAAATVKFHYGGNEVYSATGYYSVSLESVADSSGKQGIVSPIDKDEISKHDTIKDYSKLWWWLVIPAALILFIVIRLSVKNRRPSRKYSRKVNRSMNPPVRYKKRRRRSSRLNPAIRTRKRGAQLKNTSIRISNTGTGRVNASSSKRKRRY